MAQRIKKRQDTRKRGTLRHKQYPCVGIGVERSARRLLLHTPALLRINPRQININGASVPERTLFFRRPNRHAVPVSNLCMRMRERIENGCLSCIRISNEKDFQAFTPMRRATSAPSAVRL